MVCDGDNDTDGSLDDSLIYKNLGIDLNIRKIECLAHVMRIKMNNLVNNEVEAGKPALEDTSVESQSNEIKYMTRKLSVNISHLYRLALQHNDGYPNRAKAEIDAIPFHLGTNDKNASTNHRFYPFGKILVCLPKSYF